jgi:hypothetical protein
MDYSERCSNTILVKVESIVTYMHGSISSLDSLKAKKKEVVCQTLHKFHFPNGADDFHTSQITYAAYE